MGGQLRRCSLLIHARAPRTICRLRRRACRRRASRLPARPMPPVVTRSRYRPPFKLSSPYSRAQVGLPRRYTSNVAARLYHLRRAEREREVTCGYLPKPARQQWSFSCVAADTAAHASRRAWTSCTEARSGKTRTDSLRGRLVLVGRFVSWGGLSLRGTEAFGLKEDGGVAVADGSEE